MAAFQPRLAFPTPSSLPRSYYLGHHAAGLAKMRTLLSQIDLVIECRDYRIPLTSRNPMFEEALRGRERVVVYTKKDLGTPPDQDRATEEKTHSLLRSFHSPSPVLFSDHRSPKDAKTILRHVRSAAHARAALTGSHLLVVGMPNIGKSSLLNALRREGTGRGKVAPTGAQPGITRKIGTGVKIIDPEPPSSSSSSDNPGGAPAVASGGTAGVYLLDTPGVFIPYVPSADHMLKLALCGCVKDTIIPPFLLADFLLYHLNLVNPDLYAQYHHPTNEIFALLDAIARKTGRLLKGGDPDLEAAALWMVQRWRAGHLGRFVLDEVSEHALERYKNGVVGGGADGEGAKSQSQMRKVAKEAARARARSRRSGSGA
ncbi:GTPase [Hortaea werneckii]|nr:GTPase [Hortaea werneckii]KAI7205627.1 GTPase [Hortaea werneckii]KAI7595412.1 GTPase [Hortaea werneckii]KAI7662921.1 GTPase [Hortaea werneckii]RMY06465.1 hypothetical protein D0868_05853 [Hortaea werneckii]